MSDHAVSPVVATVLLIVITLVAAGTVGLTVFDVSLNETTRATFTANADSTTQTITLTHWGGAALNPPSLRLHVAVDGEPIAHQPSVPFFAAKGFMGGPTGPFNSAYTGQWVGGNQRASSL